MPSSPLLLPSPAPGVSLAQVKLEISINRARVPTAPDLPVLPDVTAQPHHHPSLPLTGTQGCALSFLPSLFPSNSSETSHVLLAPGSLPPSSSLCWDPWSSASWDGSSPPACSELERAHVGVCFIPKASLEGWRQQRVGGQQHKSCYL